MDVSRSSLYVGLTFFICTAVTVIFLDILLNCTFIVVVADEVAVLCTNCSGCGSSHDVQQLGLSGDGDVTDVNKTSDDIMVENIVVVPTSNTNNKWVGLNVTWYPCIENLSTIYDLILKERCNLTSEQYRTIYEESVTGSNCSGIHVSNLLAFWDYRVSVRARTENRTSSWNDAVDVKTLTNVPGDVRNLTVVQDFVLAKKVVVTFECPEEKSRNGTIIKYIVRKTLLASIESLDDHYDVQVNNCSPKFPCICSLSSDEVGGVLIESNYTFAVTAVNQDYIGQSSIKINIYISPRVPRLSGSGPDIPISALAPVGFVPASTTVDLRICSKCLRDSSQGTVTALGLIVCVQSGNSLCRHSGKNEHLSVTTGSFSSFSSWAHAAMLSFSDDYRATPDDWHKSFQNSSDTMTFTLGINGSCNTNDVMEYCNGPLPPDMDITISVIKCNVAGCDFLTSGEIFTTKSRNMPMLNTVGLGFGIGLGCAVILTAIIMGMVFWFRRDKSIKDDNLQVIEENGESRRNSRVSNRNECTVSAAKTQRDVSNDRENAIMTSDENHDIPSTSSMERVRRGRERLNRHSNEENEIVVISQEEIELPNPESTSVGRRGRSGSRRTSIGELM